MRCYSLDDLRDLQNKLMLMSGKAEGQRDVDHFAEVYLNFFFKYIYRWLIFIAYYGER